jgi:hypothetical protein
VGIIIAKKLVRILGRLGQGKYFKSRPFPQPLKGLGKNEVNFIGFRLSLG